MKVLLDYVLFVLLGLLLFWGREFGLLVVLAGFLLSTMVELILLSFKIGVFEFDDMIGNTVGRLIGVVGEVDKEREEDNTRNGVRE